MTGLTSRSGMPGRALLASARVLFDAHTLETVVVPVLADLQREVDDAGDSRTRRLRARVDGYLAFWRVVMAIPFAIPSDSNGTFREFFVGRSGGNLLIVLGIALLVAIAPMFGWFAFAVIAVGSVIAVGLRKWNDSIVLRRWNTRHPSELAPIDPTASPRAEINLSSIPVAGDIGGLMFVVGTFVIVLLGLPSVRWFVLGSMVIGGVLAASLFAWRSSHAGTVPRVPSILGR
jgi:hypothetical protein